MLFREVGLCCLIVVWRAKLCLIWLVQGYKFRWVKMLAIVLHIENGAKDPATCPRRLG